MGKHPSRRKRSWRARLGLLAGSLVLGAFLMEFAVLLFVGEQAKFPRHVVGAPFGVRINQPNVRYRHKSADVDVTFRINAQGMRADRDYAYVKPAGRLRIVSLGDSYTAGYEVAFEDCFSSVVERELREAGLDVEVLNAGVSGYSTAEACLYLERELLQYDPDLVMVSFYVNDLVDNLRSRLFELRDGDLVQVHDSYVPLGTVADLLNTNPVLSFLSERSNAFVFVKERVTSILKRKRAQDNVRNLGLEEEGGDDEAYRYQKRLAARIFDRMYERTRAEGIPLLIHVIPSRGLTAGELVDTFPYDEIDFDRPGLYLFRAKDVLQPFYATERLHWDGSHHHWTPFSHRVVGEAIAETILREGILEAGEARPWRPAGTDPEAIGPAGAASERP